MAAFTKSSVTLPALKNACFSLICKAKTVQRAFSIYALRNCNPVQLTSKRLSRFQFTENSPRLLRYQSSASNTSVVQHEMPKDVVQKVQSEIQSNQSRLFAVVYVSGQQFKITTNDLIQIQQHIPADVGERIRLQKVMLVGGDNFSLLGRPLLSPEQVCVEATVIEKTKSQKIVVFKMRKRTRYQNYHEKYASLSVLRINSIEVAPKVS